MSVQLEFISFTNEVKGIKKHIKFWPVKYGIGERSSLCLFLRLLSVCPYVLAQKGSNKVFGIFA
jgi:hypothetical protein